jgi:PEGA domain-containing protein
MSNTAFRMSRWLSKSWSGLSLLRSSLSLSRVQAIVGVLTGIVTITLGLYSLLQLRGPAAGMGELVAVVQEAASERSVTDATIEVLTPLNALVATLTPDSKGRARRSLKEGTYVVRVNHPLYAREVRQIQVFPQQTIEIKASLRPGSGSPVEQAKRTVSDGVRAVRRAFGF